MNFGGEAVFGERVGHGDCGSSVRSRPSWVRHPCPSSLRAQASVLDWTRAKWFARRPFDSHASNSYLATVMVPKASVISYSAGRRAGDRAHPRATYPSHGSPRPVAATAPLTDSKNSNAL